MDNSHYEPLPTAIRIHHDLHEIVFVDGAWGCGKSYVAIWDLFLHNMKYPGHDTLVIRDTYAALRDSCVKDFLRVFDGCGEFRVGPPPNFQWYSPLKGEVMFRSAEDPRDIQKFMSVPAGYVWIEEVAPGLSIGGIRNQGIPQELFAGIYARIRHPEIPRRMVLTSAPPPDVYHWTYRLFYENRSSMEGLTDQQANLLADSVTHYNIPREENEKNLSPNYYDKILPLLTSKDQVERFIYGKVGTGAGGLAVYPGFNSAFHIKRQLEPSRAYPLVRGWDGGLTPACVWMQFQPGLLLVLAEVQGEQIGMEDFAPICISYGKQLFGSDWKYQDYCDPAMLYRSQTDGKNCQDFVRPYGIVFRPGPQVISTRIHAVRGWLSRMNADGAAFLVHVRCEGLIRGFQGEYRLRSVAGIPTETPEKNMASHRHDALQYPVAAMGSSIPSLSIDKWPKELKTDILGQSNQSADRVHLSRFSRRGGAYAGSHS